ncbi:MAG: hypothetical protein EON55_17350 [Alphaproteobacteria bacterium]|nr:MAG: hypothetical protein EON55_17350 [Alphaproteobacteria bacterium]
MSSKQTVGSTDTPKSAASKLFDLRLLIGGLFTFYGVILTIYSFFDSPAEIAKAANIHINLWLGIGMLVLGLLFLLWTRLGPLTPPEPEPDDRPRRPSQH